MKKSLLVAALALLSGVATAQITDTFVSITPSNKNVVLEEFTGVNCGYCPDGHRIVNEIAAAHPGRVVPINIHTGGYAAQYQTSFGSAIASQTGLDGYPAGTVNRHIFTGGKTALGRNNFASASNQILGQASPVNIAARGTINFETRELNLTVQLYYTANSAASTNMLNVAILQDNILGPQGGMSANPSQVVGSQYNHQHMLRHLITGQWGEQIATTTAGTLVEKTFTYTIPQQFGISGQQVDAVLEDLSIAVFVAEGHQEILSGVKAVITGVNMEHANFSKIIGFQEIPTVGCENTVKSYINVKNCGENTITDLQIKYKVASGAYQTFNWHGSILSLQQDTIQLPMMEVTTNADQNIYVSIEGINGEAFSSEEKTITVNKNVYTCGGWMMLEIKTDNYGTETKFKLYDPNGNVVLSKGPFTNASVVRQFDIEPATIGCYRLEVTDDYGDGMNNGYGAGYIKLYDAAHNLVFNHNGKFSDKVVFNLDVNAPMGVEDHIISNSEVQISPNPATSVLHFRAEEVISLVEMYNMQGQRVIAESGDIQTVNISHLSNGIYMVRVTTPTGVSTQKIVKQ